MRPTQRSIASFSPQPEEAPLLREIHQRRSPVRHSLGVPIRHRSKGSGGGQFVPGAPPPEPVEADVPLEVPEAGSLPPEQEWNAHRQRYESLHEQPEWNAHRQRYESLYEQPKVLNESPTLKERWTDAQEESQRSSHAYSDMSNEAAASGDTRVDDPEIVAARIAAIKAMEHEIRLRRAHFGEDTTGREPLASADEIPVVVCRSCGRVDVLDGDQSTPGGDRTVDMCHPCATRRSVQARSE